MFNVAHNVWYTMLGALQWSVWEILFVHMWATGKLGYTTDAEVLSSPTAALTTLAWFIVIPVWRGAHFYFAHRFIHIRALYKYVHSLHHRNGDIEPFSGMTMHPVEHLYYFSCLAPSVWFATHPLVMLFNGMHLVLSPACSHSGFEDHWQSDQFHYLHVRAVPTVPLTFLHADPPPLLLQPPDANHDYSMPRVTILALRSPR
jgi:sterol desaturase/sphingolipid hydroxylase (fatty acid hydroxylase superfamily)